jgi:glutathione peroxidase
MTTIADFTVTTNRGEELDLATKKGKVLLVVNTASKCGFTPQYDGLEKVFQKYKDQGFEVLGFPCNQFGAQEPGNADEIQEFCKVNFGVTFPLMQKVDVNGPDASPLYDWMKGEAKGLMGSTGIKWNFTKFLIDREGNVVKRYAPTDKPERIAKDIDVGLAWRLWVSFRTKADRPLTTQMRTLVGEIGSFRISHSFSLSTCGELTRFGASESRSTS